MKIASCFLLLLSIILLWPACFIGKEDCGKPRQDNNTEVFINMIGGSGEFCPEVSEGNILFLDWSYITGDDAGDREFSFTNTTGFDILEGQANGRDKPSITLIARADSPESARIEVFAYNDCGESNHGIADVKVRKTPPYSIDPRITLPQHITQAATFTYDGKGYVIGGLRGVGGDQSPPWVYDPETNTLEELSPIFNGSEQSAAVIGDTAYISSVSGRYIQVYHIPSHTKVRQMHRPNMDTDYFYNIVSVFAHQNKIYVGPLSSNALIYSYNIDTGEFKDEVLIPQGGFVDCKVTLYFDNRAYYFFADGDGFVYNPNLNTITPFTTPFGLSNEAVSSCVVNGQAYVIGTDSYYKLDPSNNSLTPMPIFNGNSCFITGWSGYKWHTSSFVIGDRVYYVGGQNDKMGGGKDFFFGARL